MLFAHACRNQPGPWRSASLFMLAAVTAAMIMPSSINASTIFVEDFESYTAGTDWADATGTNGGWRKYGAANDPGQIVSTPTFTGSRAGNFNPTTTGHIWNRFNSTSGTNIATPTAWFEFYVMHDFYPNETEDQSWGIRIPKTNDIAKTRFQIGFNSTLSDNGLSGELFVSGALLNTTYAGFTLEDGNWAHIVAEVNLVNDPGNASSTAKLYAKQVAAGDTSPLTTADIMDLGGSDTVNFMWDGSIFDSLVIQNDYRLGTGVPQTLDNIAVYVDDSPIVDSGLAGDLDGDGFVGISDLNIVLGDWNQNVPPADPAADPSGDGFVGIEDLNTVLGNWNAGTPPQASTVPEPASIFSVSVLAAMMARRRSRIA